MKQRRINPRKSFRSFPERMKNVLQRIILLFFISSTTSIPKQSNNSVPLLLLISLDGFRWDYPDIYHLPNFNSIAKRGVRVQHIDNSFATVTFPSHFTIITGLYEETHGIVANHIYDPELNDIATTKTMKDPKWWYVIAMSEEKPNGDVLFSRSQNPYTEPMWISNQLANGSLRRQSGVIAWPGSATRINGHRPFKYLDYDPKRSFHWSIDQIFEWFRAAEEDRINFGVVYHFEPDETGRYSTLISSI